MRVKADTDKKEAALAEASMQSIEAAARKAYEKDLAAQQASATANGSWVSLSVLSHCRILRRTCHYTYCIVLSYSAVLLSLQVFDDASGHHYNSALRYYFNRCGTEICMRAASKTGC